MLRDDVGMGDDRTLRLACRTRRIHDDSVVGIHGECRQRSDAGFPQAVMGDGVLCFSSNQNPQGVRIGFQNFPDGVAGTFKRDRRRLAIGTDVFQFAWSETRRHRNDNGAKRERRVKKLDDLYSVTEKEHDAISRAEPPLS